MPSQTRLTNRQVVLIIVGLILILWLLSMLTRRNNQGSQQIITTTTTLPPPTTNETIQPFTQELNQPGVPPQTLSQPAVQNNNGGFLEIY